MISYANIFPPHWGGASRIYNITKILSNNNKVWLLCNDFQFIKKDNSNEEELKQLTSNNNVKLYIRKFRGPNSQIFNPRIIKLGLELIKKEKPNIIFAHGLYSAFNVIVLYFLTRVPFILDEHNVEFLRHERLYRNRKLKRLFLKIFEKLSCSFASKIFCVSEIDRDLLISKLGINKNKIITIPNGVDTEKFFLSDKNTHKIKKKLKLEGLPVILFFGKLDYKPNYEAVEIIRNEILPRILKKTPNAKFLIVGDNPPLEFQHENIVFTGAVTNIENYINASDLVICPLVSGGGTRIKILESLACSKLVISTSIGAEGIPLEQHSRILSISDDWDEFVEKTISIILNKPSPINDNFYPFSWAKIAIDIEDSINK